MLGSGRKGVKDIRQEMGFVSWNVSISPFIASMTINAEVPEQLWGTEEICGGWNLWDHGVGEQREETSDTQPTQRSQEPASLLMEAL